MQLVTMLAVVVAYPVLCLGFVLWMARFEDSLPDAVRKSVRTPDPPPILAMPVRPLGGAGRAGAARAGRGGPRRPRAAQRGD